MTGAREDDRRIGQRASLHEDRMSKRQSEGMEGGRWRDRLDKKKKKKRTRGMKLLKTVAAKAKDTAIPDGKMITKKEKE